MPDDLPFFPAVQENPQITVTTEDGRPVDGLTVHRGDILL
ncbi:MAG TPA: HtaA protein, partial [Candidatus Dietzia intestinigallinarum]|nr:HtaA protein [Candidatus Dietzia intestinigallinarum]